MQLELENKLALVIAYSGGIGFAIACALAREGAAVIINDHTQTSIDHVVIQLRAELHRQTPSAFR